MATRKVNFNVEIRNINITSASYQAMGIAGPVTGNYGSKTSFSGNTFSVDLPDDPGQYCAVTVFINSYTIGNASYNVSGKPVSMLATLYMADVQYAVVVSPGSTVASACTFAQMMSVDDSGMVSFSGNARSIKIAQGMKEHVYQTKGGTGIMISESPNWLETNSYPMFNSLCNMFYYCLTNPKTQAGKYFYDQFLELVWSEANTYNRNFLQAMNNLWVDPCKNARPLYDMLYEQPEVYTGSLKNIPNTTAEKKIPHNWTLTLKSNQSGAKNFIPAGSAFVVFDADDNAWVANNFRAGTNLSGTHAPVYKYNATPASFSPVQGGGLLGAAFGAAVTPDKKYISIGNFGWGPELQNPQEGSISQFDQYGNVLSPSNGYTLGLSRVQGMQYDNAGNLWMASVGCQDPFAPAPTGVYPFASENSAVVVYLHNVDSHGVPLPPSDTTMVKLDKFPVKKTYTSQVETTGTPYLKAFDVIPDNKGNAYISCIGNYDSDYPEKCACSAVYKVSLQGKSLKVTAQWFSDFGSGEKQGYESLRQVAILPNGNVAVVGVKSSRATILTPDLQPMPAGQQYYDVNTNAPWGIKVDRRGTVFMANFGEEKESVGGDTLDMNGPFGVTMLRNISDPSSALLLTLPSGGHEVTLANGHNLYGTQHRPVEGKLQPVKLSCYEPLMRLTATNVDGAGNLWCMNNWKPAKAVDIADNPGGDGVVIFLGIAAPE